MANRAQHVFDREADCPEKVAIIFEGENITFARLAELVREHAGGFEQLGIGKASRVGIMIPSSPEFIIHQQALLALGAIVTPLNVFYRPVEISHAIQSCDLEYLVIASDLQGLVMADPASPFGTLRTIVIADNKAQSKLPNAKSISDAIAAGSPIEKLVDVADDDVVTLLLTSATTGKSKGVMLTADNLAANYDRTPSWLGLDRNTVILCALPLYNTFGLNQCINAMLMTGATMVLLPRFDAERCIEAIERYRCTFVPAVPTMLQKIVDHPRARGGSLSSVTKILTGGAPVPAALLQRVLAAAPKAQVLTAYGLTEGTALVTLTPVCLGDDGEVEHGRTIGRVLDGMTLAITDDNGQLVGQGEVGEIVIRGPNIMRGYHRAPDDTAVALADGWLHSGDIGYIDYEGYVFIVDRKKDVIIRGGQNIYPADIEEVIYKVAGVAEVGVVGVGDDILGEVPIAFVALQPDADVTTAHILERCASELARYKMPAQIHFLEELPKGPTGKILRRELRGCVPTSI
jgi:long-chain acyl-CoA synthetase